MRIPLSWLNEFLASQYSSATLYPLLTMGIAEVESVEELDEDEVLVLELKPDRGDCLSVEGLAREVAALAPDRLVIPASLERARVEAAEDDPGSPGAPLEIRIDSPDRCGRYVGCVLEGVKVAPSPEWLQRRILQLGLRPINNVVDVTAYVMYEIGQPLHAFDLDRLDGPEIVIRTALPGERMTAINAVEYELKDSDLVIADRSRPAGIAGVMGGLDSEVSNSTTRILLESAWFQPVSVRLTSRSLGLTTDASQRFERAVDPAGCHRAARRAAVLIQEVAGGTITGGFTDLYPVPAQDRTIRLRPFRVNKILGMSLSGAEICDAMQRLGLVVEERGSEFDVRVPSRRPDLAIEEDLVEEVVRIIGYDSVPATLPIGHDTPGGLTPERRMEETIRDALVNAGFTEIRSYSLTGPSALEKASETRDTAAVRNPMSSDRTVLRPAILPNLLETAEANLGYGFRDAQLFEVGRVFHPRETDPMPVESSSLAGLAIGTAWRSAWNLPDEAVATDFYAVRGVLENMAAALRITISFEASTDHPAMHPGRCAAVSLPSGPVLGYVGEVHPEVVERYGLPGRPVAFEISLDGLFGAYRKEINRPINTDIYQLPPATRDMAVVLPQTVPFADMMQVVRSSSTLVTEARLFDVYKGPGIGPDEQSVAIALVLRAPGRTLTDGEANDEVARIVEALAHEFGARRR